MEERVSEVTTQQPVGDARVPKTRKGRESRQTLVDAARVVFGRDGYTNARASDMAAEAEMSNGAFYRYFQDKRDVLTCLLAELFAAIYDFARAPRGPDKREEATFQSTRRYFDLYRENADLYRVLIEAAQIDPVIEQQWDDARQAFFDRISRALQRDQADGIARRDLNPELAASLLGGMVEHYAYLLFVLGREDARRLDEIARHVTEIWMHGTMRRD